MRPWERPTYRGSDGSLATRGRARFQFARITPAGRVHKVVGVIVRWNFLGGTRDRPDVTYVLACGPQRHAVAPVHGSPDPWTVCARCDSATASDARRRG